MKWEMELEEIEAVLEKIWDLHDKLSDAIHSISRIHFLNSIKTMRKSEKKKPPLNDVAADNEKRTGFVFVKDFRVGDVDVDVYDSAIQEAKSLNAIRTALENLEDQLEFFHTVQIQQRAERDAAIARLEQSRIVLAMRLSEHQGKNYQVIEEALAFVGDVHNTAENLYGSPTNPSGDNFVSREGNRSNILMKFLISSFNIAKNSLKLDHVGGILGNAALVAVSMLALLHLQQVGYKDNFDLESPQRREGNNYSNINAKRNSRLEGSSGRRLNHLDVMLARG